MLVSLVGGIEAVAAVRAEREPGWRVGRGEGLRVARIHVGGDHSAREQRSVFGHTLALRLQHRRVVGAVDGDLDLVTGSVLGMDRHRIDQCLSRL